MKNSNIFNNEKIEHEYQIEMLKDKIDKMDNIISRLVDLIRNSKNSELLNETLEILIDYPRY